MISGANTEETEINISINGTYAKYFFNFFKEDKFEGNLKIGEFVLTQKEKYIIDINVSKKGENLIYRTSIGSALKSHFFGSIYADKNFKNFIIIPFREYLDDFSYEGTGGSYDINGETITLICYPAETRNDAVKMANSKLKYLDKNFCMK